MKKIIASIMILALVFSMTACGKGLSSEEIAKAEELGKMAGGQRYESYEHVEDIIVAFPADGKSTVDILASNAGDLEYFTSDKEMKKIRGIVFEDTDTPTEGINTFEEIYLCTYNDDVSGEDGSPVKATYGDSRTVTSSSNGESTLKYGNVVYNGETYEFDESKGIIKGIKWFIAEDSVKFDKWVAENKAKVDAALAKEKTAKGDMSDKEWILTTDYFKLQLADPIYAQYCLSSGLHEYLGTLVSKLEDADEEKYDKIYNKMLKQNNYENAVGLILVEKAKYENNLSALETAAKADFEKYASQIETLKKDNKDYKDTDDYLRIKAASTPIAKYEDTVAAIELLDNSIDLLNELKDVNDLTIYGYKEKLGEEENTFAQKYYQARMTYINNVIALEKFEAANKAALDTYNTQTKAIKEKYDGKKEYKDDVNYMKLQVENKDMLEQHDKLKKAVETSKEECDTLKANIKTKRAENKSAIARAKDEALLVPYLEELNKKIAEMNTEEAGDKTKVLGKIDGFYIVKISSDIVSLVDDSRDVIVHSSSGSGSSGITDGKAKYDPNDKYYSEHDYDGDGYINGDEFQDAFNDAVMDKLYGN